MGLVLMCAMTTAASAQSSVADSLDLPRSIAIALANATPLQLSRDSLRVSGIAVLEAYGRFLPSVTSTVGGFNQSGNTFLSGTALAPADAQFYGVSYQLSAGVNLFNGYRDREHARAAASLRVAAQDGLQRAEQQVAFDVSQAFYQVILDRRLHAVAIANLELSRTREAQLVDQVRIGTRAPPDLYRQQAQERLDETAVIDAQNRVDTDVMSLLRRLRIDPTAKYGIVDPPADTASLPPDSLRVETLIRQALHQRPDVAGAEQRRTADEHEMTAAHGAYLPRLNLRFDYLASSRVFGHELLNGVDQLNVDQRPLLNQLGSQRASVLSLGVSWDLFDGYRARLDVERASATLDRDRLVSEDLRLRVAADVQQALGDYHAAEQKLTASAAGLGSAQLAYDAVQGRYEVGLASFVEVLGVQTTLTQARAQHEQARTNMAFQKAVLRYATGAALR